MKRRSNWASQRQSYAGAVRQRLARIEQDIGFGVRHEAIRQDLESVGFVANLATFRTSLARARAWWRAKAPLPSRDSRPVAAHVPTGVQTPKAQVHLPAQASALPVLTAAATRHAGLATPAVIVKGPVAQAHQSTAAPVHATAAGTATSLGRPTQAEIDELDAVDLDQFFRRKSVFRKPEPK
jgi:hypothetical protein